MMYIWRWASYHISGVMIVVVPVGTKGELCMYGDMLDDTTHGHEHRTVILGMLDTTPWS